MLQQQRLWKSEVYIVSNNFICSLSTRPRSMCHVINHWLPFGLATSPFGKNYINPHPLFLLICSRDFLHAFVGHMFHYWGTLSFSPVSEWSLTFALAVRTDQDLEKNLMKVLPLSFSHQTILYSCYTILTFHPKRMSSFSLNKVVNLFVYSFHW